MLEGWLSHKPNLHALLAGAEEQFQARRSVADAARVLAASKSGIFEALRDRFDSPVLARALTVKTLNLLLAKYHFLARSASVASRPFGLIIDPSNGCNLACPGCVHSTHSKEFQLFDWNKGLMPADRLSAFLKRYGPYAIHINFCNYGEPLTNPATPKYIRQAKGFLLQTMLSTNLSIGRFDAEAYAASGLDYMLVSVDGATQPVYEKFRRNGDLSLVLRNLERLVAAKRKTGSRTPVIAWRMIAFRHNAHEIPMARQMARDLGLDQFLTILPYDVSWDDPEIVAAEVEPINESIDPLSERHILENWSAAPDGVDAEAIDRAYETGWPEIDAEPTPPGGSCQWLYRSVTIDAGGRIVPCCAAPRPDLDLIFGQFDAGAPVEVYNSDKYRLARLAFADPAAYAAQRGALDPFCARCDWNKETVNTDAAQIRQYFKATCGGLLNARTLQILSQW